MTFKMMASLQLKADNAENVLFPVSSDVDLLVYVHEPGEEIWYHFMWTPEVRRGESK